MGLRLDEWKERYENKEIVNIKNEFTINELENELDGIVFIEMK